jgi:enoyl-CoA hydratase
MNYESYTALDIKREGAVLRVTLNNPPMNDFTDLMHTEMAHVFRDISRDPETRVVMLTGAGERSFCAGGDIQRMLDDVDDHARWTALAREGRETVLSILECDKPVVARINGHAIGLGATIALCCDITVMVDTAKIADTHVQIGLVAGDGGALVWPQLVGMAKAKRYLLTGDLLTGREAAEIGLITEAASKEKFDEVVEGWVSRFATGPTRAIALTKRALNMAIRQHAQVYADAQTGLETLSQLSEDHREGIRSFLEKRPPKFTGR